MLKIGLITCLLYIIGVFIASFFNIYIPDINSSHVSYYNNSDLEFVGRVCAEKEEKNESQRLKVCPLNLSGKILVFANMYPSYEYGDILSLSCQMKKPEPFEGFAYDRYLAKSDIYSLCYYPEIIKKGESHNFFNNVISFRHKLRGIIEKNVKYPESEILKAIILGYKNNIPEDLKKSFSNIGISHIISISGLHISILSYLFLNILLSIPVSRKKAFFISSILVIFYVILISMPISAIRSAIMGILSMYAVYYGRINTIHLLIFIATGFLIINPKLLVDDVGFQLSFLAVLGIACFNPIFSRYIKKGWNVVIRTTLNIFSITLSAQIFTIPIIAYNFNIISIISPISNLLIIWTIPFIIPLSLLAIPVSSILGTIAFIPSYMLALYITRVAGILNSIPFGYFEVGELSIFFYLLYYIFIIFILFKYKKSGL